MQQRVVMLIDLSNRRQYVSEPLRHIILSEFVCDRKQAEINPISGAKFQFHFVSLLNLLQLSRSTQV